MALTIGIIGGTGMLGRSIARAMLDKAVVRPEALWVSNRSGAQGDLPDGVRVTKSSQALADACDVVVLSVPPATFSAVAIDAKDRLVLSVMAGVNLARIAEATGARRIVRAMSSPAAEHGLAYSPWVGSGLTEADKATVTTILEACGATDEIEDEAQIDVFTALAGPVPGFVAFFAAAMKTYARDQGIDPKVADRAIRQLFLAGGRMLAEGDAAAEDHVREMIDYAGTTAAGLLAMREAGLDRLIGEGLQAAVDKTRRIAPE